MKIKLLIFSSFLLFTPLFASVNEFQEINAQKNSLLQKVVGEKIEREMQKYPKEVQNFYTKIAYRPVWVNVDGLTDSAETLLGEIKNDEDLAEHTRLKREYDALLKEVEQAFNALPTVDVKTDLEVKITQLYLTYLHLILDGQKSPYTPTSLMVYSLEKGCLVDGLNAIADERVAHKLADVQLKEAHIAHTEGLKEVMQNVLEDHNTLKKMYAVLDYQPVWVSRKGLSQYSKTLFDHIEKDITLNKNGKLYQTYEALKALPLPKGEEDAALVAYELKVAALYREYMSYDLYGEIDWKKFQRDLRKQHKHGAWITHKILENPTSLLAYAVEKKSLDAAFKKAEPDFSWYKYVLKALSRYQKILKNGRWEALPSFKAITPKENNNSMIPLVRKRLLAEGYGVKCSVTEDQNRTYDACLLEAVKTFQENHGLTAEGVIGKLTQKAMNISTQSRVAQIQLNINRLKWGKRDRERYRIMVNIPAFTLNFFDHGKPLETMRVITGKKGHETPIFYNRVRSIVLNPYWRIPASIIRHEMVPKLKRDAHYLNKHHIELHTGYSEHSPRVNPLTVNWHKYGKRLPPYKFMQSPGVKNSLGKIKYLFPNQFSVYMHDTDVKSLFTKDVRAYSHGCVRLHKPVDLLKVFSMIDLNIDFAKAKRVLETNKKTPLHLKNSIPVDIVYITAWLEANGIMKFYDDIYGYDKLQLDTYKYYNK